MLTEEEAKGKWCPLTFNNGHDPEKCCTSMCMAWRWGRKPHMKQEECMTTGYCGLAGKPGVL